MARTPGVKAAKERAVARLSGVKTTEGRTVLSVGQGAGGRQPG
ncbi:hypothetical protein ACTHPH_07730 [Paenibacillus pasadenensis]|uniref:Uncharacterized protein n=1 Tax=Paenibacillus pasadenensis TaxID=217090 RepID=A0A2N5N9K6_9BACL|nr:hypothetical protein [Paenibacillus pasadenensis]PLT47013.1 hypothetical protein B8V81_1237 [Paenibacillus pasadenensis]